MCWTEGQEFLPLTGILQTFSGVLPNRFFFLVNKVENHRQREDLLEFYSLGIEKFYPMSAEHGIGVERFLDDMVAFFPEKESSDASGETAEDARTNEICIAVAGRPNVGKSSLINKLFGNLQAGGERYSRNHKGLGGSLP